MSTSTDHGSAAVGIPLATSEHSSGDLVIGAVAVIAALALVYSGTMAFWIFASGWFWIAAMACLLMLLAGGATGSLAAGVYIEIKQKDRSRFKGPGQRFAHALLLGLVGLVTAALVGGPFILFGTTLPLAYQIVAPLSVLAGLGVGVVSAGLRPAVEKLSAERQVAIRNGDRHSRRYVLWRGKYGLWPDREIFKDDVGHWPTLGILSALLGVAVGLVISLAWVIGSAYYANNESASAGRSPIIKTVTGTYVALGDSYSAGQGLGPFEPGSITNGCNRSPKFAYPELLAFSGQRETPTFEACSGAIVNDVLHANNRGRPHIAAQVTDRVHSGVGLVTITISGNDMIFSAILKECYLAADCLGDQFPPAGTQTYERIPVGPLGTQWAPTAIIAAGNRDLALFKRLRKDFPGTRILVIGYPHLFAGPASRAGYLPTFCNSLLRRYSLTERLRLRHLEDQFNARIYEAAVIAGVEFVSPNAAWSNHEPCGVAGQFLNSFKPYLAFPVPIDGGSFHPNRAGQRVLAAVVTCYLNDFPSRPTFTQTGVSTPTKLPATLQPPSSLGLVSPPGFQTSLPGCAAW
jgi:hypothetical protein